MGALDSKMHGEPSKREQCITHKSHTAVCLLCAHPLSQAFVLVLYLVYKSDEYNQPEKGATPMNTTNPHG